MKQFNEKNKNLICYQVYPSSFFDSNNDGIGDLKGITKKLSYIKELGVDLVWISPFYETDYLDGGYDVKNAKKVDKRFGKDSDFDELIKTAHGLGLKIIIDLVAGHLSENSKEFQMSALETKNEYSDLFIWTDNVFKTSKDITLILGKYPRNGGFGINFFAMQPALNYGFNIINDPTWQVSYKDESTIKTREFLLDIMRFWLNKGVDGFRVDMAGSLVKNDPDKKATIEVWNYLFNKIKEEFPQAYFVSEWSIINQAGESGFDCDFALDSVDCFRYLTDNEEMKNPISDKKIKSYVDYFNFQFENSKKHNISIGQISGNHDKKRISSMLDDTRLRTYYLIMFAIPCNPYLFAGDEIGMLFNPDLNKYGGYCRTGTRVPFEWDNSKNKGFSKAKATKLILPINNDNISLENAINDKNSIYYYIKSLISLRKSNSDLYLSDCNVTFRESIIYFDRGKYQIIFNVSNKPLEVKNVIFSSGNSLNVIKPLESCIVKK